MPIERVLRLLRQRGLQSSSHPAERGKARARAGEHESRQGRAGLPQQPLKCEPATPGVPEHREARELEVRHNRIELAHEGVERPQGVVLGLVAAAAAELVVEDDRALVCQSGEWLEVPVRQAWPAVEQDEGCPTRIEVTFDAVVGPVPVSGDEPLVAQFAVLESAAFLSAVRRSIGMGKTIVELFDAPISSSVCR